MTDSDCGSPLSCIKATDTNPILGGGPANGYCSMTCMADGDCPGGNTSCYKAGATSGPGICVLQCTLGPQLQHINDAYSTDMKCNERDDVACGPIDSEGTLDGCLPVCGEDMQCPSGRKCDPRIGVCVDNPNTGDPTGAKCDPMATSPTCAGTCLSLLGADGGAGPSLCSEECIMGGDNPYTSTPSCGGLTNGICLYSPGGNGAGDFGFCANACSKQDDCQLPDFWCLAIGGLTGAKGGVPNGFCFPANPCPNGASDCSMITGTACTATAYGPQCLPSNFPLGSATPDGGTGGTGGSGTGGSGAGGTGGAATSSSSSSSSSASSTSSSSTASSSSSSSSGSGTGGGATDAGADSGDGG